MTLEQLQHQQTQLVLQRAAAKDAVEQTEREIRKVAFAIEVLKAQAQPSQE